MLTYRAKKLIVFTAAMPLLYVSGGIFDMYFEPYVGALVCTVCYVLVICGRMPTLHRVLAGLIVCWVLFLMARLMDDSQFVFKTSQATALPIKVTYGYPVQLLVSVITAILSYFGRKIVIEINH